MVFKKKYINLNSIEILKWKKDIVQWMQIYYFMSINVS